MPLRHQVADLSAKVKVQTLVILRWLAVGGQLAALLIVGLWMGYPLPWLAALATVSTLVLLNLGLSLFYHRKDRIGGWPAALQLGFDLVELATLLFLTGGLSNPFAVLLLVPVTIGATLLPARQTLSMVVGALLLLLVLWRWHLPLPWADDTIVVFPIVYRISVLVAIAVCLLFVTFYTWQLSAEARRRQEALVATQAALERETRMGALGSLAAAAAHELGGPLGTITLIARDLRYALAGNRELSEDVQLLNNEVNRAREILIAISERAEAEHPFPEVRLPALLRELLQPFEPTPAKVELKTPWKKGEGPMVPRVPELLHGLANFLSNALRHARGKVVLDASETDGDILITIVDDGPGFPPELLPKLGEPFLGPSFSGSGSTGLGIFIATTLLERIGGRVRFENLKEGGAKVLWHWRKADIEATRHRMDGE